jgi:hypothetical protein
MQVITSENDEAPSRTPEGGKITYTLGYRKCKKAACRKCREKASHGPYWTAYFRYNSKLVACYIGKHLAKAAERIEKKRATLTHETTQWKLETD